MATYSKLPSGTWRVQVRRKGRYISETFLKRDDARRWATEAEGRIDRSEVPTPSRSARLRTFGELIEDMKSVGKAPRRSKAATLKMLKTRLGGKKIAQLDRQLFIDFGRKRVNEGAGPMTLSIDIGAIKLILSHAAAVHGLTVSVEAIDMARLALKRLGLIGKGVERDRRPSDEELERLISHFDEKPPAVRHAFAKRVNWHRVVGPMGDAIAQNAQFRRSCVGPAVDRPGGARHRAGSR